jgi:phosphate transport system permease protein
MGDFADRWMPRCLGGAALFSATAVLAILAFLVYSAIPFFWTSDIASSVLADWKPDARPPTYGIGPMVVGSLLLAMLATAIAFPMSVGICLFTQGIGPRWLGRVMLVVIHGMTAIPTVVCAFVAVMLLVPVLRSTGWGGTGYSLLSAGLTLSVLILPTMVLLMRVRIERMDAQVSLSCVALGMSRLQTLRRVVLPLSRRGLIAGLILGFCRALGDTLIALMVSGNAPQLPTSPTDSVRTLTAHIAMQVATDWHSPEYRSVAGAGLLLFLLTTGLTIALQRLEARADASHDKMV